MSERVVIVTGAGRGIGRAVAEAFAIVGDTVVIADKDSESGSAAAAGISSAGGKAIFYATDVGKICDIEDLFENVRARYARVDILVNNAGISRFGSPYDISGDEWDELISVNLRGTMFCSREAASIMRTHGGGSIVNVASTRAFMSEPGWEAYAASKGGIISLTHALAASFAADNIRVNCISPGWIETGDYSSLRPEDHSQHFSGRVGKPEDVARLCVNVTANGNEFLNGANIILDGGMAHKMIYEP
ncbi:MAG: SDR family oxidoreductase [Bacteroidales bacterium]|jgi:hypothetical protein|nr:SDR family oxidoreductase [Bacteroidales bacterium]MCU0407311.1 SDR family oxidoreductase [Bacteroidales bacterium]